MPSAGVGRGHNNLRSMNLQNMPDAEVAIVVSLVRALLCDQHEDLASLPLVEAGEGWDNKLFRLGDDFVVRLPRRQIAAALIEHEQRWLPVLAPRLPLPVPAPVRVGRPGCGFPWAWSVSPWFVGETAATLSGHTEATAVRLGEFLAALHQPAPVDAPLNPFRTSLASRSDVFVERLQRCGRQIEHASALAVWRATLATPGWSGQSVWLHGDLHPGNLVVNDGRLTAVIDFGDLTAGDPAVDLAVAWMLWPENVRGTFRATIDRLTRRLDDGVWRRARGWALSFGVASLANSLDDPLTGSIGHRTIAAVLADRDA
ncbi:MAG TPA: aminoglycoside phosphotransferase family protein [Vicinamibacterales bacterium]|nr:aminoglycoside phosphotransferase family protein [Vicinamibacterales bacterium]